MRGCSVLGSAPCVPVGHNPLWARGHEQCPVGEAWLFWPWLRPTTGSQTQVKTIRVKTTASQRADDVGQPAPTPKASSVELGVRASAGLLIDTQSVLDHRRAGVQHPEASLVPGTAPELRRTSTTSVTPDAAAEVRDSVGPYAQKSCSSRGDSRSSSLTVTLPTKGSPLYLVIGGCSVTLRTTSHFIDATIAASLRSGRS